MSTYVLSAGGILAALQVAACPTFESGVELQSTTPNAPQAFVLFENVQLSQPVTLAVTFCLESDQSLDDIQFDAIMPAHQHGLNYRVDLSEIDDTSILINNVVFHMPGVWQMQIDAKTSTGRFPYSLEFQVD